MYEVIKSCVFKKRIIFKQFVQNRENLIEKKKQNLEAHYIYHYMIKILIEIN